jgi:hypothetical protein
LTREGLPCGVNFTTLQGKGEGEESRNFTFCGAMNMGINVQEVRCGAKER